MVNAKLVPKIDVISEFALNLEWQPIISRDQHRQILQCKKALLDANINGISSVIPTFHSLTILSDAGTSSLQLQPQIESFIDQWNPADVDSDKLGVLHEIPVCYGGIFGPDLDELAEIKSLKPREIIDIHTSVEYYVYMIGFIAGFPYLGGLPEVLHQPRRNEPRVKVPAGSVGIGGAQTGIYPVEAPGGWHLIGRTSAQIFQPESRPPALIQPGDRIRFVEINHD
ncbi:MAG TPA: hypothetical protein DCE78_04160 [Bacteroidetes bacterium]|nr:hypothetical protein [Bacteroidota bacterium]